MTTMEQAVDLARRYAEVSKTRNLDELDDIFTSEFINHDAHRYTQGLDEFKAFLVGVWEFIPDLEVTIDTIFADKADDGEPWVGALVTLRGTRADNNQALELQEFWLFRIRDGKFAERHFVVDRAALAG